MGCTSSSERPSSPSSAAHPIQRTSTSTAATATGSPQNQPQPYSANYPSPFISNLPTRHGTTINDSSATPNTTTSAHLSANGTLRPPPPFTSLQAPPPLITNSSTLSRATTTTSNAPLTPSTTKTTTQPWTRTLLTRERTDFFDTRVTGHSEIWAAIRLAVDMAHHNNDWRGAGEILDAAGCSVGYMDIAVGAGTGEEGRRRRRRDRETGTTPAQDLCVWDERGQEYRCPVWVWADPVDIVEDGERGGGGHIAGLDPEATDAEDEGEDAYGGDIADKEMDARPKDKSIGFGTATMNQDSEKGKEKENEKDNIRRQEEVLASIHQKDAIDLRARFSDKGTDVVIRISKSWSVKEVMRSIAVKRNLPQNSKIKLFYLGRLLQETQTLEEQGWQPGHVLSAFVFEQ